MKGLILGIVSLTLISTALYAASVSYINAADYNSKISDNDYTVGCSNGSYGTMTVQQNGMICVSGNGKNKCSYDWGTSSASSYLCQ